MLSYKEFTRLVPSETSDFINFISPFLSYYISSNKTLEFRRTEHSTSNVYSKTFYLLAYGMAFQKEYEVLFSKYGFDKDRLKISEKVISDGQKLFYKKEQAFLQIESVIPDFQDETFYGNLFPIDILLPAFENYCKDCSLSIFEELFPRCEDVDTFKKDLAEYNKEKKLEYAMDIEQEFYRNLPISVISCFETASSIRTILYKKISNSYTDLKKIDEDIVPISLFLALYQYKDTPIYEIENISEQSAIKSLLESKGMTFEKCCQHLNINIGVNEIKSIPRNLIAIRDLYIRYVREGFYTEAENREISVRGMAVNLFSRDFTNSVAMDKLLAKMNFYIGNFANFDNIVVNEIAVQKRKYSLDYVKNFYNDLTKEVREFIDFSAKTYLLLLNKMKENKHNSKLLFCEDDADTLALFIATYYYECDISQFFKDYGITLDKILNLMNLKITKEEIDTIELDQKILVDRYKRFVREGVNRNLNPKNIKINNIANNLCDRAFNRSMIMEMIFSELSNTKQLSLQSEFLNQLQAHIEQKENRRKMNLTQTLFRDLPVETMEYLEATSRIHTYLSDKLKNWREEDIKNISLLLAIFSSPSKDAKDFFEFCGFSQQKICSYLEISANNLLKNPVDIDLLTDGYGSYIFEGKNKGKGRKDLTVINIAHNIFFRDINNSVAISRFLSYFNHAYGDFERFDEYYQSYVDFTKEKLKKENAEKTINSYSSCRDYLRNVFRIHNRISSQLERIGPNRFLAGKEDIAEASMILALFTVNNSSVSFFQKNNITSEKILKQCGLYPDTLKNLYDDSINYVSGTVIYSNYLQKDTDSYRSRRSVDDFAKRIFDITINGSMFLENISADTNVNYDILKEEVETGKDYELSLSIDDRINLLSTEKVDILDVADVKSVLHFGNSLSIHSKYIYDEYPKLSLSDTHKQSVEQISSIINRVYEKQISTPEPKKGFFAKLISKKPALVEERTVINPSAIQELKEEISKNIASLSDELQQYDNLRRYMEAYRRKNRMYYLVVSEMIVKLQENLQSLDPKNDDHYHSFLTDSSRIQIMTDKANRFAETNQLTKQELFKINQAIVNHFITINALEMARDHLLPLVESEMAIGMGRETENQSLMLSQGVINLFQSLLSRNVETAAQNMEQIKKCNISSDIFDMLNKDISIYFDGIHQAEGIQSRIEPLDIDQIGIVQPQVLTISNEDNSINLTLTGVKPKEKVLVPNSATASFQED